MIREASLSDCWPKVRLGDVVEFLDHMRKPITAKDRIAGPYPYYGANGQQDSVEGYIFDEPLILLAEDGGNFGDPNRTIAYQVEGKCWVNNHAHVLRPTSKIDIRYLCRHLEMYDVRSHINGATREKLNKGAAQEILISLPPIKEQKRIAAILDKTDAIRRKRRQAIDLTDQLLRAVFLDMFGDPVTNPKGLKVAVIGDFVNIKGGYAFKSKDYVDSGVRLVKISNVHAEELIWKDTDYVPNEYLEKYAEFSLNIGDLVIALTRPIIASQNHVKVASISKGDLPVLLNQRVGKMEIKSELLVREYIEQFLYSDQFRNAVEKLCSVALQPNISTKQIEGIELLIPPLEQQIRFREISERIKKSKYVQNTDLKKTIMMFESLTQQAFNGQLSKQTKAA